MWSALRWIVLRVAAIRWLFKLGWLGTLIPIALLLKTIGLPLLGILSVLAIPLLILLFLFGLPIILVLAFGGLIMGIIGAVLTIGVAAIKIGLFVVLPIWLMLVVGRKLFAWLFKRGGGDDTTGAGSEPSEPPPPPPATASAAADGFDVA
jgi:hypothetical protein